MASNEISSDDLLQSGNSFGRQIGAVGIGGEKRVSSGFRAAAFNVRSQFLQAENARGTLGKMHFFRGEDHKSPHRYILQGAVGGQKILHCPLVTFVLQDGGMKANDLFAVDLRPFLFAHVDSAVVTLGFDDIKTPLANEDVIHLRTAVTGIEKYVVEKRGAGKFRFQIFLYGLFRPISEMANLFSNRFLVKFVKARDIIAKPCK